MNNLNSVLVFNKIELHLKGNPISCNACQDHDFIVWLVAHKHRISDWEHVVCKNRNDKRVSIDETIIRDLSSICIRSITICIWATVCLSLLIFVITSAVVIVKRQKKN